MGKRKRRSAKPLDSDLPMDDHPEPTPRRPWPWLFVVVYGLHLLDEGLVAGSLPMWATEHGYHFTTQHWLSVSLISFCLFSASVWMVARRTWPPWVLVTLAHIGSLPATRPSSSSCNLIEICESPAGRSRPLFRPHCVPERIGT